MKEDEVVITLMANNSLIHNIIKAANNDVFARLYSESDLHLLLFLRDFLSQPFYSWNFGLNPARSKKFLMDIFLICFLPQMNICYFWPEPAVTSRFVFTTSKLFSFSYSTKKDINTIQSLYKFGIIFFSFMIK